MSGSQSGRNLPLEGDFEGQGSDESKWGDRWETTQRGQKHSTTISIVELTSIAYCYDMLVSYKF